MKEPGQSRALSLPDPTTAHHPSVGNRLKLCQHVINKRTWRGRRRHARQETPGCRALSGSDIEVPLVASVAISLPTSMLRCVTTPSNEATTCWHVFGCDDNHCCQFRLRPLVASSNWNYTGAIADSSAETEFGQTAALVAWEIDRRAPCHSSRPRR